MTNIDPLIEAAAEELSSRMLHWLDGVVSAYALEILIDAARYLEQRGNIDNDALQLLDDAMVRVMHDRDGDRSHALDSTCWCLREYTALDYYEGVRTLAGAMDYLDKRGRLDDDALDVLHCAHQDALDAWKAAH